jgi:hypothetical protein
MAVRLFLFLTFANKLIAVIIVRIIIELVGFMCALACVSFRQALSPLSTRYELEYWTQPAQEHEIGG